MKKTNIQDLYHNEKTERAHGNYAESLFITKEIVNNLTSHII